MLCLCKFRRNLFETSQLNGKQHISNFKHKKSNHRYSNKGKAFNGKIKENVMII